MINDVLITYNMTSTLITKAQQQQQQLQYLYTYSVFFQTKPPSILLVKLSFYILQF